MNSNRVLILRPDNIGDVVLFSGAMQHIRSLYPDAHITIAVQAHIVNLIELCTYKNDCVPINKLTWWGKIGNLKFPFKYKLENVFHTLNSLWNVFYKPFDIIIFPIKSPTVDHLKIIYCLNPERAYGITGCSLCAPKTGYPFELQPKTLLTHYVDVSRVDTWQHELLTTLYFLRFLGCHVTVADDIKPQFWLLDTEKNYLDGVQRNGQKIIGLFPGASHEKKYWEATNFGELAKLLGGLASYVIFGSNTDKIISDRVVFSLRENCEDVKILNLTGQTTLRELAKTIASCDLFISMDTAALHIAIAANVPTIGIVGGGHFGRFIPWGDPSKHIFLTHKMDCFHCNWQCIKGEVECIKGVSARDVASAAINILEFDGDGTGIVSW